MTVTLELSAEAEQAIERKARRQGITTSEYLRRMVERSARQRPAARPRKAAAVDYDDEWTEADMHAAAATSLQLADKRFGQETEYDNL